MRWPLITTYSASNGGMMAYGGVGSSQSDADVIGRAQKIEDWVLGK